MKVKRIPRVLNSSQLFSPLFLIVFFLLITSFLAIFSSGTVESEDGWLYLSVARNIYYEHRIEAPPNEYPDKNVNMNTVKSADGTWYSRNGLGYSIALLPAVALSDVLFHYYHAIPPTHFPLESDWSVLFFASFINIVFTGILGIGILLYARLLGWTEKQSILLSLVTIFTTNIMSMSKFGFIQMMYATFLFLTFLFLEYAIQKKKVIFWILTVLSFLIFAVSYNQTFFLATPALGLYFLLRQPRKMWHFYIVNTFLLFIAAVLFSFLTIPDTLINILWLLKFYPKVIFEGFWGIFFSSGKSVFIYSPLLTLLLIFWHKFRKEDFLILIPFGVLILAYIALYSFAWITNPTGQTPIWNGGMGWGLRYIVPLIPFAMILVFKVIGRLNIWQRRFLVYPLVVFGIFIQILGMNLSYLLQYAGLPSSIFIGEHELNYYDYASFIPRFSPVLMMLRQNARIALLLPSTIKHGPYDLRLYDGFDLPLKAAVGYFRGFRREGHVSFENKDGAIDNLDLILTNAPDSTASSALVNTTIQLNKTSIATASLPVNKDIAYHFTGDQLPLQAGKNYLDFYNQFETPPPVPHVIYIKELKINGQIMPLASLDYPDASALGSKTTPIAYQYYGYRENEPWELWSLRARLTERTFDFWWIKNLYYWDKPQGLIWALFALDLGVFGISTALLILKLRQHENT